MKLEKILINQIVEQIINSNEAFSLHDIYFTFKHLFKKRTDITIPTQYEMQMMIMDYPFPPSYKQSSLIIKKHSIIVFHPVDYVVSTYDTSDIDFGRNGHLLEVKRRIVTENKGMRFVIPSEVVSHAGFKVGDKVNISFGKNKCEITRAKYMNPLTKHVRNGRYTIVDKNNDIRIGRLFFKKYNDNAVPMSLEVFCNGSKKIIFRVRE